MNAPLSLLRDAPDGLVAAAREAVGLPVGARVVAAMSGGVESSTGAAMLTAEGHSLVGLTMQLWNQRRLADKDGIPEQVQAEWWERADFHVVMYEQITETIQYGVVTSVEVKVYDGSSNDPVADITVER